MDEAKPDSHRQSNDSIRAEAKTVAQIQWVDGTWGFYFRNSRFLDPLVLLLLLVVGIFSLIR